MSEKEENKKYKMWIDESGAIRCGKCKRILMKTKYGIREDQMSKLRMCEIEIKCHSCKMINI